jgi:type II secretory pathway pseudopilin PulG
MAGRRLVRRTGAAVFSRGLRRRSAFTLVEVVIAVGLVGFVLTAILGLAALAANETKNADLKARLAWITESTTSEFQSQRFSTALGDLPVTTYRDFSGMPLPDANGAYFRCDVLNVTPVPSSPNFALLQLTIRWPSPSLTSKNVSLISLFNYQ